MRRLLAVLLLAVSAAFTPLAASAAPITVPPGLNPGDQYRLAFVTSSQTYAYHLVSAYNNIALSSANSVPQLAALATTWKAIVSTPEIDAWDNTGTNPSVSAGVPVYNLGGQLLATSNADLWDGELLQGISYEQTGLYPPNGGGLVWTGTLAVYPSVQTHPLGADPAWVGFSFDSYFWASANPNESFFNAHPIYAMSGIVTVVPEPGTMLLACVAATGLAVVGIRKRRGTA